MRLRLTRKFHLAGVHVHFFDAEFGRGNLFSRPLGDADIVRPAVLHALEIVREREGSVARDVVDRPRQDTPPPS